MPRASPKKDNAATEGVGSGLNVFIVVLLCALRINPPKKGHCHHFGRLTLSAAFELPGNIEPFDIM